MSCEEEQKMPFLFAQIVCLDNFQLRFPDECTGAMDIYLNRLEKSKERTHLKLSETIDIHNAIGSQKPFQSLEEYIKQNS